MSRLIRVACLQTRPMSGFAAAIDEAMPLAEGAVAEEAQFVALPEYCGGLQADGGRLCPPAATQDEHPIIIAFSAFARQHRCLVMLGSVAIDAGDGRIWNRSILIDDQGGICASYDKIHLFDVQLAPDQTYRESSLVNPGKVAVVADTPLARLGLTICYDLRFPQLYRTLAQAGAEILTCPAAFTRTTGQAHWHVLNRARAIENTCFVVAPCAVGEVPGGGASYGHSLVVDPWGTVLADGGGREPAVVCATIDLDKVAETARRIPSLTHDRELELVRVQAMEAAA